MEVRFVYITCGSQHEAETIGAALVEERLAACVNLIPGMTSMYRWQGKIEKDQEYVMIAKTNDATLSALIERVTALHSYEVPCIEALSVVQGHPAFLNWIHEEVAQP